jgi:DNA-binding beta-propeller fold protein YncE
MQKAAGVFLLTAFCTLTAMAQGTFVYTNNDQVPNSISGFSAAANGALSPVAGSPFATGGNGSGGGFAAANRITTAVIDNVLYAANTASNNVSAFSINPVTGVLTALPGSPFATGGIAGSSAGMSLTATPDKKFLIAANGTSATITVFSVAANGTLSPVPGSPFASGASGQLISAKATSDGKFLAVSATSGTILMFTISAAGALAPAAGSPVADAGAAGIDCNCASTQLFVALNAINTRVDVFDIAMNGALSRIAGSPFSGTGMNSNVAVLSPDDSTLFVTDQASNTITVFSVAANGSLAVVTGSPFPVAAGPAGAATNRAGNLLYTASFNNLISGFSVAPNGALTAVPGSPFSNGFPGTGLLSLAVFPAKTCCPPPIISNASATPDILWPPNHELVDVTIDFTVTEPCPHTCVLSVSSDEPINGIGDGNTSPDWQVIDAHHALLRAERSGPGNGRIYTVTITCTNDLNQETSSENVLVLVPHDQSRSNRIDDPLFLVHQQYLDFLNREPDTAGLQFYLNILNGCQSSDTECNKYTRGALSANFFRSPEFQRKGSYVIYLYMVSLGQRPVTPSELNDLAKIDRPHFSEFTRDLASISTPNDDPVLTESKKAALADGWIQRPEFQTRYGNLSNADFVQALLNTAGVAIANQSQLVNELNTGAKTRGQVLRAIAESPEVNAKFYKQAFVTMEYFGYLRRDPEDCHGNPDPAQCGYIFHNQRFQLVADPDFLENTIVRGFIESPEYRQRFGQP